MVQSLLSLSSGLLLVAQTLWSLSSGLLFDLKCCELFERFAPFFSKALSLFVRLARFSVKCSSCRESHSGGLLLVLKMRNPILSACFFFPTDLTFFERLAALSHMHWSFRALCFFWSGALSVPFELLAHASQMLCSLSRGLLLVAHALVPLEVF